MCMYMYIHLYIYIYKQVHEQSGLPPRTRWVHKLFLPQLMALHPLGFAMATSWLD